MNQTYRWLEEQISFTHVAGRLRSAKMLINPGVLKVGQRFAEVPTRTRRKNPRCWRLETQGLSGRSNQKTPHLMPHLSVPSAVISQAPATCSWITPKCQAGLEFHWAPFFLKSADINQASGFRAAWGKSQFHKGKAAGAGKNEHAEGLLCCVPGQECRPRPRLRKGASAAKRWHWECACRGAGKGATGPLLPGGRPRASWEPSCHIKAPGEGVEVPSPPILTRTRWSGERRARYLWTAAPLGLR